MSNKRRYKLYFNGYCECCGGEIWKQSNPIWNVHKYRFCSRRCKANKLMVGKQSLHYKNGKSKSYGYIILDTKCGPVREHRFIMSQHIGRPLKPNEVVHHKDGNKENNVLGNLELLKNGQHTSLHLKGKSKSKEHRHKLSEIASKLSKLRKRNKKGQFNCERINYAVI